MQHFTKKPSARWKTAVYVRESRDDLGYGRETLDTQRDMLLKFAYDNGYEPVDYIYEDNNISGAVYSRPGILSLRKDAEDCKINLLLLKDLSRLGRSNSQTLLFIETLEEMGVRVLTADGRYDSLTGSETLGIDTWYNERYLVDISRKTRSSLKFRIERGDYIGTAPYGYRKSVKLHNRLEIFESEAVIVKRIFNMYLGGFNCIKIGAILESDNIIPPGFARKINFDCSNNIRKLRWHPSTITRMLDNRVYIGDTVQGISRKLSYKSKKTYRLPREEWIITENTHEPIIEKTIYDEVSKMRKLRGSKSNNAERHLNLQ